MKDIREPELNVHLSLRWEAILNEKYDDLRVHLPPDDRESMDTFAKDLFSALESTARSLLLEVVQKQQQMDRKEFGKLLHKESRPETHLLFKIWSLLEDNSKKPAEERESEEALVSKIVQLEVSQILQCIGNKRKFEESGRPLAGGISYKSYSRTPTQRTRRRGDDDEESLLPIVSPLKSLPLEESAAITHTLPNSKRNKRVLILARYFFPFNQWIDSGHERILFTPMENKPMAEAVKKEFTRIEYFERYEVSNLIEWRAYELHREKPFTYI